MELRQLSYFLAAAHTQNFRKAAGLQILPIADVTETFIFALVYRRIGPPNKAAQQFLNTVQETTMTIVKELSESW
jgi:DNA-binding transcriptional LysR family regulator